MMRIVAAGLFSASVLCCGLSHAAQSCVSENGKSRIVAHGRKGMIEIDGSTYQVTVERLAKTVRMVSADGKFTFVLTRGYRKSQGSSFASLIYNEGTHNQSVKNYTCEKGGGGDDE